MTRTRYQKVGRTFFLFAWGWVLLWISISLLITVFSKGGIHYHLADSLLGPRWPHIFGFDAFGRDLFLVSARGGLNSIGFSVAVVVVATTCALFFASLIAAAPPSIKFLALRLLDFSLAFPSLLVAIAWAAIRGPGWSTLWFALLVGTLPMLTRLLYARTQEVLVLDFIEASQSLGGGKLWILWHHIIPNLASVALLKTPVLFAHALMAEATLSFLGLGAPIGTDTWGSLLAQGKDYLIEAPHLAIVVGVPLVLTILSLQKISDSFESSLHLEGQLS
jgi:peptide/nickel transport system permease protein